jgi:hypothetical protein
MNKQKYEFLAKKSRCWGCTITTSKIDDWWGCLGDLGEKFAWPYMVEGRG